MPEAILVLSSSVFLYTLQGGEARWWAGEARTSECECWTGCERSGEGTDKSKASLAQNMPPEGSTEGTGKGNSTQWHQSLDPV